MTEELPLSPLDQRSSNTRLAYTCATSCMLQREGGEEDLNPPYPHFPTPPSPMPPICSSSGSIVDHSRRSMLSVSGNLLAAPYPHFFTPKYTLPTPAAAVALWSTPQEGRCYQWQSGLPSQGAAAPWPSNAYIQGRGEGDGGGSWGDPERAGQQQQGRKAATP